MLIIFTDKGKFDTYTDVPKIGVATILVQNGNVVTDIFHQLNEHEKNYLIHNLEMATIVFAQMKWKNHLYGASVRTPLTSRVSKTLSTQ